MDDLWERSVDVLVHGRVAGQPRGEVRRAVLPGAPRQYFSHFRLAAELVIASGELACGLVRFRTRPGENVFDRPFGAIETSFSASSISVSWARPRNVCL